MAWALIALAALFAVGGRKVEKVIEVSHNRKKFQAEFLTAAADPSLNWGGIPVLFALAHADFETAGGTGSVYLKTKNLFSLTVGSGWKEPNGWNGQVYTSASGFRFRVYDKLEGSMKEYIHLLHFPLYKDALAAALRNDVQAFANAVKSAGYDSTEPKYAKIFVDRYNAIRDNLG